MAGGSNHLHAFENPCAEKSEDYDSLSDENVLYLSDEFEEAVTSIDTYTIMNKNYIYIGSTKMPLEILENSKQDELCIGGKVMIKKDFLMSIDAISKPIYYNLLDYSKKERDLDYLIDKTNRHFCEIKNPYVPNTDGFLNRKYLPLGGIGYSVMIVAKDNKFGLIDEYSNTILPIENDELYPTLLRQRPYWVVKHGKVSYIYHVLRFQIVSNLYDEIKVVKQRFPCGSTTDEYFKVYANGKCGLIHEQGEEIVPPVYDDCYGSCWFKNYDKKHKYIIVTLKNKKGILNELGEVIAEIKYDKIQFSYPTEGNAKNLEAKGWIGSDEFILIDSGVGLNKLNIKSSNYEKRTYEKYGGSYAQDEMGYSDDDIDTIFDGDPDAYWNID